VPVYYEPRLVTVGFDEGVTAEELDDAADELTRDLDETEREQVERSVAVINAIYGSPERLRTLAADIVAHWEKRRARMFPGDAGDLRQPVQRHRRAAARVALRRGRRWGDQGRLLGLGLGSTSDQRPCPARVGEQGDQEALGKARRLP
jgi:type I restriction enzyme R subunit